LLFPISLPCRMNDGGTSMALTMANIGAKPKEGKNGRATGLGDHSRRRLAGF
jgi:hypothetical protein